MPAHGCRLILSARVYDIAVLIAGAALPLAFAPFGFWPLAPISVAVLFYVWLESPHSRALWRGWLYGVGMFGVGVSWVVESFQYGFAPLPIAVVLTGVFVAFLALFPAILGYLVRRFARGPRWVTLYLVLPAGWIVCEWVRASFLTGFTWLQLGYSQLDTPLAGLFPLVGVYGVGFGVALSAAVLVGLRGMGRAWVCCALVVLGLWGASAVLRTTHWTQPGAQPLAVALVQGNIPQEIKWAPEQLKPTLDLYVAKTREHWAADLVVWPETALPGTLNRFELFLAALGDEARANATDLLLGVPEIDAASREYFNSVVSVGARSGRYRKYHLVPFGEYLPLKPVFQPIVDALGIPVSNFSHGPLEQPLLEVAGQKVGVSICYEAAFGNEIIRALPQAALLVNVSNDAWFGDSIAPHQHLEIARARALETGRYMVRATNTGISAFIGPRGELLSRTEQFETMSLDATVFPMTGATWYVRLGDTPVLLSMLALLGVAALLARHRVASGRESSVAKQTK